MNEINCNCCDCVFETESEYYSHLIESHKSISATAKKILILGGGFGGVTVLREIEKKIGDEQVEVTLVSDENYFLFTPMLPQVISGLLHPSNITIPIRNFCKKAKFFQAKIDSIDLFQRLVTIQRSFDNKVHTLEYDYLVLALGGKTNFFNNSSLEKHSFPMKTIEDAISIRNHIILMLEHAAQTGNHELQKMLLTFVVVGSGLAGVETVSEINHFVRNSIKNFYPNINPKNLRVILVSSQNRILPEIDQKLATKAMNFLERQGITILKETRAKEAGEEFLVFENGEKLSCATIVWTGGITPSKVISKLNVPQVQNNRIKVDAALKMDESDVFVLGDCALINNTATGKPYPSTAQHAIREGKVIAENLKRLIEGKKELKEFSFQSMGLMAIIGKKTGLATILGHNLFGISAWVLWRFYYLTKFPTLGKKLKISTDWSIDFLLPRDITLIGDIKKKKINSIHITKNIPSIKEQLLSN